MSEKEFLGKKAEDSEEEKEEDEADYTLSQFYQSNTREDLQNQLKDINFEEEGEKEEEKKEFKVESGGTGKRSN